jgi:hypothetical protein
VKGFVRNSAGTAVLVDDKVTSDRGATGFPPVAQLAGLTNLGRFQCVRLASGAVRCWGDGTVLGTGKPVVPTTVAPAAAKDIAGLTATEVATDRAYGCARTTKGMTCWGTSPPLRGRNTTGYPFDVEL